MRKAITYSSFTIASLMVFLLFLTAKTYSQVAMAVILYPAVAYIALNLVPRRKRKSTVVAISVSSDHVEAPVQTHAIEKPQERDSKGVADIDRRAFFKLIGAAGLSFFIFSLFSRRAELPFFGKLAAGGAATITITDPEGTKVDPSRKQPLDGYHIAEIDDNIITFYGMSNKEGSWVITREDTDTNSFRYAKGDSDFGANWEKRENLTYKYFHDVF